jgi:hypothetical protein
MGGIFDQMPIFKHFASVLVDDGAKEMLSCLCCRAPLSGCKMVDGEGITERNRQRWGWAALCNGNGVHDDTVHHVDSVFMELIVGY